MEKPVAEAAAEIEEEPVPTAGQRWWRVFHWRIIPGLILALMAALLLWAAFAVATRISLSLLERNGTLCAPTGDGSDKSETTFAFDTRRACHPTALAVEKGRRYFIQMDVGTSWSDGGRAADPRGLSASDLGVAGYVGVPLRRAVGANYLQPVVHIQGGSAGPVLQPLELQQRATPLGIWRGEFVAARSGRLSLFANEGMLPFRLRLPRKLLEWPWGLEDYPVTHFYDDEHLGNRGDAIVTIKRVD
jgi:hypothetical protein